MAIKQTTKIGKGEYSCECSLLNEAYLSSAWASPAWGAIYQSDNATANALYTFYSKVGENVIPLMSRPNGIIATLGGNTLRNPISGGLSPKLYNELGAVVNFNVMTSSGLRSDQPCLLSILYDDDIEEASMVWGHFYAYSSGKYKARIHSFTTDATDRKVFYSYIRDYISEPTTDPWADDNYSDLGGGDGNLDITSDVITIPDFPSSLVDSGFVQIFTPTITQLNELSDYMWNGSFIDNLLKLWNNPMDILISLIQLPFYINSDNSRIVHAGNVITTVYMNYPDHQYHDIDCGSLEVKPFYDSYLDYSPYTTCDIYLPYIGYQSLSMDEIMGKTLSVKYRVDLITGTCMAIISCNDSVMYVFTGNCATNIPLSSQSFDSIAQSAINIGLSMAKIGPHQASVSDISSIASNVMSAKPNIQRSGSVSANAGMMAPQKPFLVFTVARICLPSQQNTYLGYPVFINAKISELVGYTEIEEIRLDKISCTDEEKREILQILKGGFIV